MTLCERIREFFCGKPPMDNPEEPVKKRVPSCLDMYKKASEKHLELRNSLMYTENNKLIDNIFLKAEGYTFEEGGGTINITLEERGMFNHYKGINLVDEYFIECVAEMINNNRDAFLEEVINTSKNRLESIRTDAKQEARNVLCVIDNK